MLTLPDAILDAVSQYAVRLTPDEREQLSRLLRSGKSSARIIARARTLLKVDEGWNAPQVAAALDISNGRVRCTAPNGGTLRKVWMACCRTGSRPTDTGSLMTRGRPT